MKTFQQYMELAAYDVGTSVLGRTNLDANSEAALTAAFQAFELIMAKNPGAAGTFLNRMTEAMPELKAILQQHGLDSFRDSSFRTDMRRGAAKGRKVVSKGLADVSADDVNGGADVVAANSADSFHNPLG
jgi:hypothetical protein